MAIDNRVFIIHGAIMSGTWKKQKPTVGFWANLFVIARSGAKGCPSMRCISGKHAKVNQREKKWQIVSRNSVFFCQTGSFRGDF
jgi:hypothetical protein